MMLLQASLFASVLIDMLDTAPRQVMIILGLFVIVFGLMGWSFLHDAQNTYLSGTQQAYSYDDPVKQTLPAARDSDPSAGSNAKNAVQVSVFSDIGCISCRLTQRELVRALEQAKRPVRVVWRDLPSGNTRTAITPTLYSKCMQKLGKFWEYHDALLSSNAIDEDFFRKKAEDVGISTVNLAACVSDPAILESVKDDIAQARQHNIIVAPTTFVGTEPVNGYVSQIQFARMIQDAK